jgi:hypothetical protein
MTRTSKLRAALALSLSFAAAAYGAEMTIFTGPNFSGADLTVRGEVANLDRSGFNDRAESVIVRSGRWEVCSDANFSGYCTVLGPGDYRLLEGPLYRRVSSARELAPLAYDDRRPYDDRRTYDDRRPPRYGAYPGEERSRYSALEVYTLPGFRGSTMKFDGSATTLDTPTTNEGVSSLIVREGVWELCTNFESRSACRVYEPGRYPRLGNFEGAPVSSLRRIG